MKLKELATALIAEAINSCETFDLSGRGIVLALPGGKYYLKVDMPLPSHSVILSGNVGFVNSEGVYLGSLLSPNDAVLDVITQVGEYRIKHVMEEAARKMASVALKKARKLKLARKRLLRIGKNLTILSKGKVPKETKS